MAKATRTIKQVLNYQAEHSTWFAANQTLFNRVVAFSFDCIQAHVGVLDLTNKEALTALEMLTHATEKNPSPAMPLSTIGEQIPAYAGQWKERTASSATCREGGEIRRDLSLAECHIRTHEFKSKKQGVEEESSCYNVSRSSVRACSRCLRSFRFDGRRRGFCCASLSGAGDVWDLPGQSTVRGQLYPFRAPSYRRDHFPQRVVRRKYP
jgi:hypothetical protein